MKEKDIIDILKESEIGSDNGFGGLNIAVSEDEYITVAQKVIKLLTNPPILISNK